MAVILLVFGVGASAAEPKRVLLLQSYGPDLQEESGIFTDYLRRDLADKSPVPLELHEVSLDAERLSKSVADSAFAEYVRALFADRPPDLLVTMSLPAARFAQRHRQDLFASTPFVFAMIDEGALQK